MIKLETKKIAFENKKINGLELNKRLTQAMYLHTMEVFDKEGPGWAPLKPLTRKQRVKAGFGAGPILDRKRGNLGLIGGIVEAPTNTEAVVGVRAVIKYAAIHQFGGIIYRTVKAGSVWLRTGRKGNLIRQKGYPNLAMFKKKKNKLGKEVKFQGGKNYQIAIPQRKFLVFTDELMVKLKKITTDFIKGL